MCYPMSIQIAYFINVISVYPQNCTKFYGPHQLDCLVTIWINATCVVEGYKYPRKLSTSRLNELDTWNIRYFTHTSYVFKGVIVILCSWFRSIIEYFNAIATSADDGSRINQTYCFGMGELGWISPLFLLMHVQLFIKHCSICIYNRISI